SSHILSELENLATRFVIVNHGKKIDEFTKEELQERLQSYFEIKVDNTDLASQLLETQLNTTEFEVTSDGVIHVFDADIEDSDIAEMLVKNNLNHSHLSRKPHNLQEMFINLTAEAQSTDEINSS